MGECRKAELEQDAGKNSGAPPAHCEENAQ